MKTASVAKLYVSLFPISQISSAISHMHTDCYTISPTYLIPYSQTQYHLYKSFYITLVTLLKKQHNKYNEQYKIHPSLKRLKQLFVVLISYFRLYTSI